jgi:hypothetical protein
VTKSLHDELEFLKVTLMRENGYSNQKIHWVLKEQSNSNNNGSDAPLMDLSLPIASRSMMELSEP